MKTYLIVTKLGTEIIEADYHLSDDDQILIFYKRKEFFKLDEEIACYPMVNLISWKPIQKKVNN